MNKMPLVTFHELQPAAQFRDRLHAAGLETCIDDESRTEKYWFLSPPLAAIHVEVDESDYDQAVKLVEGMKKEGAISGAVQCPECGSTRVEYPQISRKFFIPRLAGGVLMALKFLPRAYYCLDCKFTCPESEMLERRRDLLGWPEDSPLWHDVPHPMSRRRVS